MEKRALVLRCSVFLSLLLLVAGAALAGGAARPGDRVAAGFDYWQTLGGGATRYSFAQQPIPADFFCVGSQPFRGTVEFEGVPLRTAPDGILGTTDTIVERLDEAAFNKQGVAVTRVQVRALNLIGTKLVSNRCGAFKVTASLAGQQPVTRLTFHRQNQYGGVFDADLRLRVQVTFTEVKSGMTRTLVRDIAMPTVDSTPFALKTTTATPIATCADVAPAQPAQPVSSINDVTQVTLLDGHVTVGEGAGQATKTTPRPEVLVWKTSASASSGDYQSYSASTGCLCDGRGHCMQMQSWHQPDCRGGLAYDCELHFTHTACELGFTSQCPVRTQDSFADQLTLLRDRGFIHEDPVALAAKQVRSADQIRQDQAQRLAAQVREIEKQ